jgi:predicted ATPase
MPSAHRPVFINRVVLKNFRSIESCDVFLGPLVVLVGANGAGKSNFLDALRLVSDGLTSSLDHALRERGGIQEVRRRSSGHPTHFGVRLEFTLSDDLHGSFAFEIAARPHGEFSIKHEECRVGGAEYEVKEGQVIGTTAPVAPPASPDRLYLVSAAGLPEFRPVFDALTHMGFYNLNPAVIRNLQGPDKGEILSRDGRNLASVTARLEREGLSDVKRRIDGYLEKVVPGIVGFEHKAVGHMETVEFKQRIAGAGSPWRFPANNMSDGTLRAAASLVALFQSGASDMVRLVGIEEPETALHPAAAAVLRDCLYEASRDVQVVATSHSAELLDDPRVRPEDLRAVESQDGTTYITDLDQASCEALRDHLFTAGELLRQSQLTPDYSRIPKGTQLNLFDGTS